MSRGFNLTAEINLRGPANLRTIVADIRRQLGTVTADVNVRINPTTTRNVAALSQALSRLNNTLSSTNRLAASASLSLNNLANAGRQATTSIANLPRNIQNSVNAVGQLNARTNQAARTMQAARTEFEEFGRQSALAARRFAAISVVTGAIYKISNAISSATADFISFNKELVRVSQVTDTSLAGLGGLVNEITALSTSFGVASKDLIGVSSTLAQAGLSARDTEKALKALALSAMAPSFDSLNDTVEGSIALMRQFNIGAGDLEQALGSINAVSAKFAVEAGDIITAIQRTGGVFAAASKGVSEGKDALNEFIAVFTSVRATTRESAETIATGLRTIFTRIQRAGTIDALKEYGVVLTDLQGKFVGPYEAVRRLAEGLNQLDPRELRFSRIVEELGGFRQIGKVIPLIQQFATAQQALLVAQRGQGSLANDAATAQQALAVKISKVREEFIALIRSVGQSDSFQSFVGLSLDLASALIKVADAAKNVLPAITAITAIRGASFLTQFATGFAGGIRSRRNSGGYINRFAIGGMVPGQGNSDTVPAMLTPGEFVIRKKAVETIGVNNLARLNRNGGGPVGVQYLNSGGPVQKLKDGQYVKSTIGSLKGVKGGSRIVPNNLMQPTDSAGTNIKYKIINITTKDFETIYKNINFERKKTRRINRLYSSNPDALSIIKRARGPDTTEFIDSESVYGADNALKGLAFERYIKKKHPDIQVRGGAKGLESLLFSPLDFDSGDAKFGNDSTITKYKQRNGQLAILSKRLRQQNVGNALNWTQKTPESRRLLDTTVFIPPYGIKEQFDRWYADRVNSELGKKASRKNRGGFAQKFMAGGIAQSILDKVPTLDDLVSGPFPANMTFGPGEQSWNEILGDILVSVGLPYNAATKRLQLATQQGKTDLSLRDAITPRNLSAAVFRKRYGDNNVTKLSTLRNKIMEAYSGKRSALVEKSRGRTEEEVQAAQQQGLLFGAVGMLGSEYRNRPLTISRGIQNPIDVVVSGYKLDEVTGKEIDSGLSSSLSKATRKASKKIMIGNIIKDVTGGNLLGLDFDRTLAVGADQILADPKEPRYSEFGNPAKVVRALSSPKTKLTGLGTSLVSLVNSVSPDVRQELLGRMRVITARPQSTVKLIQRWLRSVGLPISPSNFTGIGGPGITGDQVAQLKAQFLTQLSEEAKTTGSGVSFVDDDKRNEAEASKVPGVRSYLYKFGRKKESRDMATAKGVLFQDMIRYLGGPEPNPNKKSIDFPNGIGAAAKYFNGIPPNIPTDAKRTITGASDLTENIKNYLISSGEAQRAAKPVKLAYGGLVEKFSEGEYVTGSAMKALKKMTREFLMPRSRKGGQRKISFLSQQAVSVSKNIPPELLKQIEEEGRLVYGTGIGEGGLPKGDPGLVVDKIINVALAKVKKQKAGKLKKTQGALTFSAAGLIRGPRAPAGQMEKTLARYQQDPEYQAAMGGISSNIFETIKGPLAAFKKGGSFGGVIEPNSPTAQKIKASLEKFKTQTSGTEAAKIQTAIDKFDDFIGGARPEKEGHVSHFTWAMNQVFKRGIATFNKGGKVDYYSLEKNSGFNSREFNDLVYFAKTNDFTLDEFKKYLIQRLQQKKAKADLRVNPYDVLRAITPESSAVKDERRRLLADSLKGPVDSQYNPAKKFAKGGSAGDTVPALLTPGEFVINKKAASRIGSAGLHRLNHADKIQGFNKGGAVGRIQKFVDGGGVRDYSAADSSESNLNNQARKIAIDLMKTAGMSAKDALQQAREQISSSMPGPSSSRAVPQRFRSDDGTTLSANAKARSAIQVDVEDIKQRRLARRASAKGIGTIGAGTTPEKGSFTQFDAMASNLPQNRAAQQNRAIAMSSSSMTSLSSGQVAGILNSMTKSAQQSAGFFDKIKGAASSTASSVTGFLGRFKKDMSPEAMQRRDTRNQRLQSFGLGLAFTAPMVGEQLGQAIGGTKGAGVSAAATTVGTYASVGSQFGVIGVFTGALVGAVAAVDSFHKGIRDAENEISKGRIEQEGKIAEKSLETLTRRPKDAAATQSLINSLDKMSTEEAAIQTRNAQNKEPTWLGKLGSTLSLGYVSAGGIPKMGTPEYKKYLAETGQTNAAQSRGRADVAMQALSAKGGTIEDALSSFGAGAGKIQESIASANVEYATELEKQTQLAKKGIISDAELSQAKQGLIQKYYLQETEGLRAAMADKARATAAQKLAKAINLMSTSIGRTFSNMEAAISKASDQLSSTAEGLDAMAEGRSVLKAQFSGQNIFENPNAYSKAERRAAISQSSGLFGKDAQFVERLTEVGSNIKDTMARMGVEAQQSGKPKELVAEEIQRTIDKQLRDAFGDNNLSRQISEQLRQALKGQVTDQDTKEIDLDKLLEETTGLTNLIESEQKAFKALANATKLAVDSIDLYNKQIEKSISMQNEAIAIRTEAISTKAGNDFRLTEVLGGKVSLQDRFRARVEEGASAANVKASQFNLPGLQARLAQLEATRTAVREDRTKLQKNAQPTDPKTIQNIANFNRSLAELDNEVNLTKNSLKNLPKTIQGAMDDVFNELQKKVSEFEAKQQAGASFGEQLVTSTPTELLGLNNTYNLVNSTLNKQVRTIQQSVSAQQAYLKVINDGGTAVEAMSAAQTAFASENKAAFSMFSELLSVAGIEKPQANVMRADFLETMAKSQGMNLQNNPLLNNIIASLRKQPDQDPEIQRLKELYGQLQASYDKAAETARKIVMDDASALIIQAGKVVKDAIETAKISFNDQQLRDMGLGISRPADVMNKSKGGVVYASGGKFIPKGTDTVPAMLSPGEFVVNAQSTSQNLPLLNAINKNKGGVVQYFAGGTKNPVGRGGPGTYRGLPYRNIPLELVAEYEHDMSSFDRYYEWLMRGGDEHLGIEEAARGQKLWAVALREYGPSDPRTMKFARDAGIWINKYGYPLRTPTSRQATTRIASYDRFEYGPNAFEDAARRVDNPSVNIPPARATRGSVLPTGANYSQRLGAAVGDAAQGVGNTLRGIGRATMGAASTAYGYASAGVRAVRGAVGNVAEYANRPYAGLDPAQTRRGAAVRGTVRAARGAGYGAYYGLRGAARAGNAVGTTLLPTLAINAASENLGFGSLSNEAAIGLSFGVDAARGGVNAVRGASAASTGLSGVGRFAAGASSALSGAVAVNTVWSGITEGISFLADREGYSNRLAAEDEAGARLVVAVERNAADGDLREVGSAFRYVGGQALSGFLNPFRMFAKAGRAAYTTSSATAANQSQQREYDTRVGAERHGIRRGSNSYNLMGGRMQIMDAGNEGDFAGSNFEWRSERQPVIMDTMTGQVYDLNKSADKKKFESIGEKDHLAGFNLSSMERAWIRDKAALEDKKKRGEIDNTKRVFVDDKDPSKKLTAYEKANADLEARRFATITRYTRGYVYNTETKERIMQSSDANLDAAVGKERKRIEQQRIADQKAQEAKNKAEQAKKEQDQAKATKETITRGATYLWNGAVTAYNGLVAYNQGIEEKNKAENERKAAEARELTNTQADRFLIKPASPSLIDRNNELGSQRAAKLAELADYDPASPQAKKLQKEIDDINQQIVDGNFAVYRKFSNEELDAEWSNYNKAQDRAAKKQAMEQIKQEKLAKTQAINKEIKLRDSLGKATGIAPPSDPERQAQWRNKVLKKIQSKFYLSGDTAKDIELMTAYGMSPDLAKTLLQPMTDDQKAAIYDIMAGQTRGGLYKYSDNDLKLLNMSKDEIVKQRLTAEQKFGSDRFIAARDEKRRQELERAREKEFGRTTKQLGRYDRLAARAAEGSPAQRRNIQKNLLKQLTKLGYIDPTQDAATNTQRLSALNMNSNTISLLYPNQTGGMLAMKKARGGIIYASAGQLINFQPQGTDTVPAMLTPGEFVVNAKATKQNLPLLQAINKRKGGQIGYYDAGGTVESGLLRTQQSSASISSMQSKVLESISKRTDNINSQTSSIGKTSSTLQQDFSYSSDQTNKTLGSIQKSGNQTLAYSRTTYDSLTGAGYFSTGGMVYASKGMLIPYKPRGTDTVPAMLTPGEFVVNRQATAANLPLLKAINNGSDTATSFMASGGRVNYMSDGGLLGRIFGPVAGSFIVLSKAVQDSINALQEYQKQLASTQPNSVSTSGGTGQLNGLDGLGQFVVKFDQFINAVNAINLPPVINLQVAPIQVNITGAEALTAALEGPMGAMLTQQISDAFGRLSAATEGAIPS